MLEKRTPSFAGVSRPSGPRSLIGTLVWSDMPPNIRFRPLWKLLSHEPSPLCHFPVAKVVNPLRPRICPSVVSPRMSLEILKKLFPVFSMARLGTHTAPPCEPKQ